MCIDVSLTSFWEYYKSFMKKKAKETIVEEMRVREKKWNKKPDKKISYNSDHRETL